ncbi:MAG: hypothetical protein LW884_02100 [Bacteroidetes bacterium]|jgi:hypothetical protein|nr:hypothetical protein [Bacteroidota bacterium]
MRHGAWFLALYVLLAGCVPEPDLSPEGALQAEYRGLFVLSEGQWNQANATLDYYDAAGNRTADVFSRVNGQRLGDVANSVLVDADTLFIVMNTSRLLYKVQLPTLRLLATLALPEASSPRNMVRVRPDLAYVNNLYGQQLYRIDPRTLKLLGSLPVEDHTEDMVLHLGQVYLGSGNYPGGRINQKLAILDPTTEQITYRSLPIENPGPIRALPDGQLAICCRGNYLNTNSAVVWYQPATGQFTDTVYVQGYLYDMAVTPDAILLNSDQDISAISLADHSLRYRVIDRANLGARDSDLLYALHYEPATDRIYLTNAGFGAQDGQCYVLDRSYRLLSTLPTGVFPGTVFRVP